MNNLENILAKFNDLGIVNEGLTTDVPQKDQLKDFKEEKADVKIDEAEFEITYKDPQFTGTKTHTVKAVNAKGAEQKFLSFGNPHKVLDVKKKEAVKEAILEGKIPNEYKASYDFMIQKGIEIGLAIDRGNIKNASSDL